MTDSSVSSNLKEIHKRIENACNKAGREPSDITLIAVSKTKPVSDILTARQFGQIHFGENRRPCLAYDGNHAVE